jgi:predicted RecB family nuclease
LATDAPTIAEKTAELSETIENLQAIAQLLMVPGIDEKRSELLVRFGITSRRELASQDPVQLYRGLVGIAKTYVENGKLSPNKIPTIEDVSSWIKQAHL